MVIRNMIRVLFVVSEVFPLTKTGGLGDVAYSLPHALHRMGADMRLVLPAYRAVLMQLTSIRILGWLTLPGSGRNHSVRILEARPEGFDFPVWLVDCPALFDRPGNPYVDEHDHDWPDNAERFSVLCHAALALAQDQLALGWVPDVVHANDWQTGLIPALLSELPHRPKSVFTIHNLAYGGHFSLETFRALGLSRTWWRVDGVEFYGGFSMLKAGIVYADEVTTVSPTYAREICTAEFGHGLEGVLQMSRYKLHGILNGIDEALWDPQTDPYLSAHYSAERRLPGKALNKQALLHHFDMFCDERCLQMPLIGMVSRLVAQKGIDLVLAAMTDWLEHSEARFVVVGSGQIEFERRWLELRAQYPQRLGVFIGYDEMLAHLVEAGSDMFLMPSRFEPCGLNQMYSLRYGTPPVVYRTGGLADTVFDATNEHVSAGIANGFVFDEMSVDGLKDAVSRALTCYAQHRRWQALQRTGMKQSFSWDHSAATYLALYRGTPAMRENV